MELELLTFIKENDNWKELLQEKQFSITIKEDENYYLFSYSQIDSDFSLQLVRECRGIILRKTDLKPVCVPFFKFFNVQEGHAETIDWNTARVQEKIDGSIIKVWHDNEEWHYSTNGTINSFGASLQSDISPYGTFGDLFDSVFPDMMFESGHLQENKTYMFELVSPYNRVVVPYRETQIWHIGTRDNDTLEECNDDIGIQKPKEYNLYTLDDCLNAAKELPFSEEGYVVVDQYWNRVKIKSPAYVSAHHLKNNGVVTKERIVDMIRANGQDDFLAIYPEWKKHFEEIQLAVSSFAGAVINDMIEIPSRNVSRKEFALWAKNTKCPPFFFALLDNREGIHTPLDWLWLQTSEKILKWIGVE